MKVNVHLEKSWTSAKDLELGDTVVTLSGEKYKIEAIDKDYYDSIIVVYNFEVEDNHNYYVGDNQVLVHNDGCTVSDKGSSGGKYSYDLTPGVDVGQPILFGQKGVSPTFGSKGRFRGASIQNVVRWIRKGKIDPGSIRVQYIWVNGEKVVVNNRSLTTLSKAGLKPVDVKDMTGGLPAEGPDSLESVLKRLDEMGGRPSNKIPIRSTDDWNSAPKEWVELP